MRVYKGFVQSCPQVLVLDNGVLDEKLNLDETHLFWCSLFRKYQRNFSPGKNTANGKKMSFEVARYEL